MYANNGERSSIEIPGICCFMILQSQENLPIKTEFNDLELGDDSQPSDGVPLSSFCLSHDVISEFLSGIETGSGGLGFDSSHEEQQTSAQKPLTPMKSALAGLQSSNIDARAQCLQQARVAIPDSRAAPRTLELCFCADGT